MEEFEKCLYEIYLNFDTLEYLKNENESNENIIKFFKDDLDYPENLTNNLIDNNKSFLKSIALRIKLKLKNNINPKIIKEEILNYDKKLECLLDKLLNCENFSKKYDEFINVENNTIDNSVVDNTLDNTNKIINEIKSYLEKNVIKTEDSSDIIKVSDLYKNYKQYSEEDVTKNDFKDICSKILDSPFSKNGFVGYKLCEE